MPVRDWPDWPGVLNGSGSFGGCRFGQFWEGGQHDGNDGSFFGFAGNHDGAAVALHDAEDRGEAQAAADKFGGKKRVEEFGADGVIHAAAGVADFQNDVAAGARFVAGPGFGEIGRRRIRERWWRW